MKILAQCEIPDELANAWLQHLRDFDTAHPGCHFEVMMQSGRTVPVREMIAELTVAPALTIEQVFARKGGTLPAAPKPATAGPDLMPFERAAIAIRRNPKRTDRAIAREIGVSHQTVMRARDAIKHEKRPGAAAGPNQGPDGPGNES
jgi:hypothetical protein